jgi:hypothetical protein
MAMEEEAQLPGASARGGSRAILNALSDLVAGFEANPGDPAAFLTQMVGQGRTLDPPPFLCQPAGTSRSLSPAICFDSLRLARSAEGGSAWGTRGHGNLGGRRKDAGDCAENHGSFLRGLWRGTGRGGSRHSLLCGEACSGQAQNLAQSMEPPAATPPSNLSASLLR